MRNRWETVEKPIRLAKLAGRRNKGEANNRIRPLGSRRTEELKLRQAREPNNFCLRWTASRDRVRFQIVGVRCIRRRSTVLKHRQQRWRYDKRKRWAHLICALRHKSSPASKPARWRDRERERNGRRNPTTRYFAFVALLLDRSFILGNREKYRVELSTEFYLIDLSLSLSLSSAEITRKQRAGDRAEKYVGSNDQISSSAARLLARVYLSDGDRPSENRMKGNGCARTTSLRTRSDAFKSYLATFL